MKVLNKFILLGALSFTALSAQAAPIVLGAALNCTAENAITGIAVGDVTGDAGGASDCWGTYNGNDPGPSGEGFSVGGTVFDFVAKQNTPGVLEGADIGLVVTPADGAPTGTWAFDSSKFNPTEFLIVLKAANNPGFAAWLFTGDDAASDAGDWAVAWTAGGSSNPADLSHLSVYAPEVPIPAAAWLFGSGLIGLAGIARKRKAS